MAIVLLETSQTGERVEPTADARSVTIATILIICYKRIVEKPALVVNDIRSETGHRPAAFEPGLRSTLRLLIDILHPAHVHVFRNLAEDCVRLGHSVFITMREKECTGELLDQYGLDYETLSRQRSGAGLAVELVQRSARLWRVVDRFRPHFLTGIMGPSIAPVGRLHGAFRRQRGRVAVFYDTEIATLTNAFVYPLADYVCTPDCYKGTVRGNHVTYPSYHELAYLHPRRFDPDAKIVRAAGIDPESTYFVVRFVSYRSSHDLKTRGLSLDRKLSLVRMLAERGRVVLSSESPLPRDLEPYRVHMPARDMHHVLAFAKLFVGESATMASECAVLGVPAVYVSPLGRGYTDEQETRYGLVHNFVGDEAGSDWVASVRELLADVTLGEHAREARQRLLRDKIDLTAWMLEFFEREYRAHFTDR